MRSFAAPAIRGGGGSGAEAGGGYGDAPSRRLRQSNPRSSAGRSGRFDPLRPAGFPNSRRHCSNPAAISRESARIWASPLAPGSPEASRAMLRGDGAAWRQSSNRSPDTEVSNLLLFFYLLNSSTRSGRNSAARQLRFPSASATIPLSSSRPQSQVAAATTASASASCSSPLPLFQQHGETAVFIFAMLGTAATTRYLLDHGVDRTIAGNDIQTRGCGGDNIDMGLWWRRQRHRHGTMVAATTTSTRGCGGDATSIRGCCVHGEDDIDKP